MGLFDSVKKVLAGETISFEKTTHDTPASGLLTEERQAYIGSWRGPDSHLVIKADGTVEYRSQRTVGDTTNSTSVAGPIDSFDGSSFIVGVLGNNTPFDVSEPPGPDGAGGMTMTVNGEPLTRE
jgi:hypothetical protein